MVFRTLLTFHALEAPLSTLDPVVELARISEAHLDVVVLGVLNAPPVVLHDVAPAAEWVQHNNEVLNDSVALGDEIGKYIADKGVSATVVAECDYTARMDNIAARYGLCTDLHVATTEAINATQSVASAFNGTLFDAGCPSLLLPAGQVKAEAMTKVAIAWDGRKQAAHAVNRALPLLTKCERANVIVIDPKEDDVGQDPGSDLATYLARHDINVTVDVLASGGKTVSEKLLQRSKDVDADLLVMGAYGHSKFREWLLGGATRDTLEQADIPLFMAH